jgi:hypothetical protein
MRRINPGNAAIAVGTVIGLYHLIWVTIVALGWAKPVLDFILRLHFIDLDVAIAPFVVGTAAALVVITFTLGALFGFIFALVWNWLGGEAEESKSARIAKAATGM